MIPRKDDYRRDFRHAAPADRPRPCREPDLVVWSETAFVPEHPALEPGGPAGLSLRALVRDFLAYQKAIGRWLLTGNDDYSLVERTTGRGEAGLQRLGALLPPGERVETYHKIHLVPFTEYFPFKKQLPGIYELLQSFDAYLWEPGDRRVVFQSSRVHLLHADLFRGRVPRRRAAVRRGRGRGDPQPLQRLLVSHGNGGHAARGQRRVPRRGERQAPCPRGRLGAHVPDHP